MYTHDVFISYSSADQSWVEGTLLPRLEAAKITIFHDFVIGVPRLVNIEEAVKQSRYTLVVLTPEFIASHWTGFEHLLAMSYGMDTQSWPVLPILLKPCTLPPYIALLNIADLTHQARRDNEIERLIRQIRSQIEQTTQLASIHREQIPPPRPYADPHFIESLLAPSGTEPLDSVFYIKRNGDTLFLRELLKKSGTTTIIRAPRQTGKSSLLIRGVAKAVKEGSKLILLDLQSITRDKIRDIDTFLHYISVKIAGLFDINVQEVEEMWSGILSANDKMTNFMEKYVLSRSETKVIFALDEADILLETDFRDSFFSLLRYWHNNRASSEDFGQSWHKLDIAIVISTDPSIIIKDINRSPFNVGTKIFLDDFNNDQVQELNNLYSSPLEKQDMPEFMDLFGGHPYLTRQALYTMVNQDMTWIQLQNIAQAPHGPFDSHLETYVLKIREQPSLRSAFRQIIETGRCSDKDAYNRLFRIGLVTGFIKGQSSKLCRCRCKLYSEYLRSEL